MPAGWTLYTAFDEYLLRLRLLGGWVVSARQEEMAARLSKSYTETLSSWSRVNDDGYTYISYG